MTRSSRTQYIALPLVVILIGGLFILFAAAMKGVWAWILVGVLFLVVLGVAAAVAAKRWRHPPASDTPRVAAARRDPGVWSVLVACDDVCDPTAIADLVAAHAAGRAARALVVAPALGSRLDRLTGDESAYSRAREHLEATVRALESVTEARSGTVGSHDPIQAIDEALRVFPADEIVLAVQSEGSQQNWLAENIVVVAGERYDIPITPLVADPAA
jgi:hypothetical protein